MREPSQKERIKKILIENERSGRWFSTVDAVNIFILRLGAIIFDLKKDGVNIEERRVAGKTYSEYRIKPRVVVLPPARKEPLPKALIERPTANLFETNRLNTQT